MKINPDKTRAMKITFTRTHHDIPAMCSGGETLGRVTTFILLGIIVSSDLTWGAHCHYMNENCSRRLYVLLMLKPASVPATDVLKMICLSRIKPLLEYAWQVWHTSAPDLGSE